MITANKKLIWKNLIQDEFNTIALIENDRFLRKTKMQIKYKRLDNVLLAIFAKNILIRVDGNKAQINTIKNFNINNATKFYIDDNGGKKLFPLTIVVGDQNIVAKIIINNFSCHPTDWCRYIKNKNLSLNNKFAIDVAESIMKYKLVTLDDWIKYSDLFKNKRVNSSRAIQVYNYKIDLQLAKQNPSIRIIQADYWWQIYNDEEVKLIFNCGYSKELLEKVPKTLHISERDAILLGVNAPDFSNIGVFNNHIDISEYPKKCRISENLEYMKALTSVDKAFLLTFSKSSGKWEDRNITDRGGCIVISNILSQEFYDELLEKIMDNDVRIICNFEEDVSNSYGILCTEYHIANIKILGKRYYVYISRYVDDTSCAGYQEQYDIFYARSLSELWFLIPDEQKCIFCRKAEIKMNLKLDQPKFSPFTSQTTDLWTMTDSFHSVFKVEILTFIKTEVKNINCIPVPVQEIIVSYY